MKTPEMLKSRHRFGIAPPEKDFRIRHRVKFKSVVFIRSKSFLHLDLMINYFILTHYMTDFTRAIVCVSLFVKGFNSKLVNDFLLTNVSSFQNPVNKKN